MLKTHEARTGAPATPAPDPRQQQAQRLFRAGIVSAIGLGILVRASHVLSQGFPLNDGGMFYVMARELQRAGYRLPAFTGYNAAEIPFAYPPLGLYVAGAIDDLTPLSLLTVFRLLPLVVTCATLVAFFLLARAMLVSRLAVVVAVVAFALAPRAFIWPLMGGGVTRAFGLLFALLALHQVYLLYTHRQWRFAATTTLLAALTVLSHLETGWFLAYSIAVFVLAFGRHRQGLVSSLAVAAGTIALTAPWWAAVLAEHGAAPFIAANQSNDSIIADAGKRRYLFFSLLRFVFTGEALFPLIGAIALLGVLVCLLGRRPLLPLWWALIILLSGRSYATFTMVPLTLLAGVGVAEALLPLWGRNWSRRHARLAVLLGFLLAYTTFSALTRDRSLGGEAVALVSLSPAERAAMRWVSTETPSDARFLVVTGGQWWVDRTAEWFPALADRVSVATVQGTEWLPGRAYQDSEWLYEQAQQCAGREASCLSEWEADTKTPFTHVYIPKLPAGECCGPLRDSLAAQPGFATVYDGPGATVFARN